ERSLNRRAIRGNGVGFEDVPVHAEYIERIESAGAKVRVVSRLLNAVSVDAGEETLRQIEQLPFVRGIAPVGTYTREYPIDGDLPIPSRGDYGTSLQQNYQLRTDMAHRLGLSGDGVLISIHDTGFKLDHESLIHSEVLGAYDFVDDDSIVSFEPGDPSMSESHGTMVWSIISGYYPGQLIGTGFGASVLLARTEHYTMEDPIEEDFWIAAAEWADSAGADIISTSLGYYEWYSPDSMTGDIAPISIAARLLTERGICCVICAGNNGSYGPTSITAPGDAHDVITVGAVDYYGNRLGFSSRGPTADGRIKPEVSAMGSGVKCAGHYGTTDFRTGSGTSASAPLISGLVALMLEARPELNPLEIRSALIATSSRATSPNNEVGWGVPDAISALAYPAGGRTAIAVFAGWNFVSLPLADVVPVDVAFPRRVGDVFYWDADLMEYVEATAIEPAHGYFVFYTSDTLLLVDGAPLDSYEISVSAGWHAIGGAARLNTIEDVASRSSVNFHSHFYVFNTDIQNYVSTKTLQPGKAAFVLVTGEGTIRLE
ncbi:MAG TPA: hypothetical protein ENN07_00225, partial [candidate division Zixibacteria bacterium]|nr:hypothetical protein [candidate division Zixibacteria bacterium]